MLRGSMKIGLPRKPPGTASSSQQRKAGGKGTKESETSDINLKERIRTSRGEALWREAGVRGREIKMGERGCTKIKKHGVLTEHG